MVLIQEVKKKQETLKIILLIEFLRQQSAPHNSTRFPHLSARIICSQTSSQKIYVLGNMYNFVATQDATFKSNGGVLINRAY